MLKLFSLMERFKWKCMSRGWKTSEGGDWVAVGEEYHNFLAIRSIHPSSFKAVAASRKCVVRDGLAYRVVDAAYTAWLFSENPPQELAKLVAESLELSRHIALYDLTPLLNGDKACIHCNYTDSVVFREFENFLERECGVHFIWHPAVKRSSNDLAVTVT